MAGSGTLNIGGVFSGFSTGTETVSLPGILLSAAVGEIFPISLAAGDNTITVPAGTTMALVAFPATSATVKLGPGATPVCTMFANTNVTLWFAIPCTTASIVVNISGDATTKPPTAMATFL